MSHVISLVLDTMTPSFEQLLRRTKPLQYRHVSEPRSHWCNFHYFLDFGLGFQTWNPSRCSRVQPLASMFLVLVMAMIPNSFRLYVGQALGLSARLEQHRDPNHRKRCPSLQIGIMDA